MLTATLKNKNGSILRVAIRTTTLELDSEIRIMFPNYTIIKIEKGGLV